jgi:hypothetical protein
MGGSASLADHITIGSQPEFISARARQDTQVPSCGGTWHSFHSTQEIQLGLELYAWQAQGSFPSSSKIRSQRIQACILSTNMQHENTCMYFACNHILIWAATRSSLNTRHDTCMPVSWLTRNAIVWQYVPSLHGIISPVWTLDVPNLLPYSYGFAWFLYVTTRYVEQRQPSPEDVTRTRDFICRLSRDGESSSPALLSASKAVRKHFRVAHEGLKSFVSCCTLCVFRGLGGSIAESPHTTVCPTTPACVEVWLWDNSFFFQVIQ